MNASSSHYPLAESTWGTEELDAMRRVIDSGFFSMGKNVRAFEEDFAAKFDMKHAVMVNSGSSANLVAIAALAYKKDKPLRPGDEVIVPAISWATTYYPLLQYGLKLKFVDVDIDTLNADIAAVEAAITPTTRMIVAVSILGNPAPLAEMRALCDRHGLYFFEDNCESMGAAVDGKMAGTYGDLTTHSLFFSHHISTMEGGVIMSDDRELADLCRVLRNHGWSRDLGPNSPVYQRGADDFYEAYKFILPGYNVRPLELSGAVGIEQLRKLDGFLDVRRQNAKHFVDLFQGDERFTIQRENGSSSWFSFTVILNGSVEGSRRRILDGLRHAGIEHRIITGGCFTRHDVIKYFDYETFGDLPNANTAHDRGFFVGNFPRDARRDIDRFHSAVTRLAN